MKTSATKKPSRKTRDGNGAGGMGMGAGMTIPTLGALARLAVFALVIIVLAIEFVFIGRPRSAIPYENLLLFPAIIGFCAFVAVVIIAWVLRPLLKRDEEYYDD